MQANTSFWTEYALYRPPQVSQSRTIVDLGCGNGTYASLLAEAFPRSSVTGVDPDPDLIAYGQNRPHPKNLKLINGDFTALETFDRIDLLISRLVTMYVKQPEGIASWAKTKAQDVVIIDAADDLYEVFPDLPLFAEAQSKNNKRIEATGGNRDVVNRTEKIWTDAGFRLRRTHDIIVQNVPSINKYYLHHMMLLHAHVATDSPPTLELMQEIFEWSLKSDSYLQYGLRARHFNNPDT
ncbi:class I SAM-dependent methyltransferase [Nocardia sp. NPDC051052]|uniref:class I SAM-dependent methyltransferase n=1 Tax=Nocardia sp. NPDC051052 TaxID=3364322 RepID=UPI0037AFD8CF